MEQELGNITVKTKKSVKADMEVYKCPHLSCSAFFIEYNDLLTHKVKQHGDMPKFFKQNSLIKGKRFSKERLGKENMYMLKYKWSRTATMLGIMFGKGNKKSERNDAANQAIKAD